MIVILNRTAGVSEKSSQQETTITRLFAEAGVEVQLQHPDKARDLTALAVAAARDEGEIVVAGGGDGTISAVAGVLAGSKKTLGVLPLGTLNHFAKDLGLPLELPDAVATIVRGRAEEIDVGEVNGRVFINNSSLGMYPDIVASREAQQAQLGRGKWHAFVRASWQALQRYPFLKLRITVEGEQIDRQTAFLFVGNNEYEFAGLNQGIRACVNRGRLGLYFTRRTSRLGLLRLAAGALTGRLQQANDFDAFCVEEAVIETCRARLLVATDGEVEWMETPLKYRARPRALRVMVPHPKAPA